MSSEAPQPSPDRSGSNRGRPVVLCILDGWGSRRDRANNAIAEADTPVWDRLLATCPWASLDASGAAVGLPVGQMGNSEVGHTNIGAGRVVMQDLPRIDRAIADGELDRIPTLQAFIDRLKARNRVCHLLGLLSPGGVHAHDRHLSALVDRVAAAGIAVKVHAFLDGRDTPPRSAGGYVRQFGGRLADGAAIATVSGRYYAMDRDRRWERVAQAYGALVHGAGRAAVSAEAAIAAAYDGGEGDEFVRPTVIAGYGGMRDGDGLLMANFRADRARQILAALVEPDFDGFARGPVVDFAAALGMVGYSASLDRRLAVLFPSARPANVLGEVVAQAGMRQLRIAETEKYAHVTFFLNGGAEHQLPGESRILVPSPKIATYDLAPEMSAVELTDRLVAAVTGGEFDLIVVNYANPDMVGHTGILAAAVRAVECIDRCLDRLSAAVAGAGGVLLITADHGNIEQMTDPDSGEAHTAHTTNPVPVVLVDGTGLDAALRDGRLCDVAPTVLGILGLEKPVEMTGESLLIRQPSIAAGETRASG